MARAQFEYDEAGNTFYYVVVSFYCVILFPLTHTFWPAAPKQKTLDKSGCRCEGCIDKQRLKDAVKPRHFQLRVLKAIILIAAWSFFVLLVYKVSQIEHTHEEYDPYKILGLDQGADTAEVKKKYRDLSKIFHPDRGGNATEFDNIAKAYQALTDDESRENWEKYGNPDGPKATTFGIALPKWIVSEKYGLWVLAFYGLLFMIILPVAVGYWWYSSMKYSADKVLMETSRVFCHFLQKTPHMEISRVITVLSGAFEFWRKHNTAIIERESDEVDMPRLMKELRNINENTKEAPFYQKYSVKARALFHAYLSRVPIESAALIKDQEYIIGRMVPLIDDFLRVQLQMMLQGFFQHPPAFETLENVLKVYPMVVQALWTRNSPLLQLPHITESNISFLRKKNVSTCDELASLEETKRRQLLNTVTEDQYEDILRVLQMMPRLSIEAHVEVPGEDDSETVTVGSLVTIKVTLTRSPLLKRDTSSAIAATVAEKGIEGPAVHCPFYPGEKQESWYVYLVEKKSRHLSSFVVPCKGLFEEKQLQIQSPNSHGIYFYNLVVRSDSYMELYYQSDLKIEVQAAREPVQVTYADTDDEMDDDEVEQQESESSYEYTEGEASDTE